MAQTILIKLKGNIHKPLLMTWLDSGGQGHSRSLRSSFVNIMSHELLEQSQWNLQGIFTSPLLMTWSYFGGQKSESGSHLGAETYIKLDVLVTHADIAASVGIVLRHVCLFVRALTGKRIELSTPDFVHVYSIAVAWHALTQRSKFTRLRKPSRLLVTVAGILYTYMPLCYLLSLLA